MAALIPTFLLGYSDSSFTNPHEVLKTQEPQERTGTFTHMGAQYWGFESKRHIATTITDDGDAFDFDHDAHEYFDIGFKTAAVVSEFKISTRWFTGNQVPVISIQLMHKGETSEVLHRQKLSPDAEHQFDITPTLADECRILCYHEGGISRVNIFGELAHDNAASVNLLENVEISHISNEHYGRPHDAVSGSRQVDYMLGWESARTGFGEQAVFHLQAPAQITQIDVDTYLHRLNPPLSCHVYGLSVSESGDLDSNYEQRPKWSIQFEDGSAIVPEDFKTYMLQEKFLEEPIANNRRFKIKLHLPQGSPWLPIVPFGALKPDTYHRFKTEQTPEPITHLLYMHYPNGGIHGLKAFAEG